MPGELRFSFPLRPWHKFYCAAGFLDPEYFRERGKWHRGVDLNLRSGGDSDLGYPILSLFPGTVVAAGNYGSWGGIVVVRADEWVRRLVSDALERPIEALEVQLAHLLHITVNEGEVVNAGECLGAMGKGGSGRYLAHLHMECRTVTFDPALPQGGSEADREEVAWHCLDPLLLPLRLPFSDHPTTLAQKRYLAPSRRLEVEHDGEAAVLIHPVGEKLYLRGVP